MSADENLQQHCRDARVFYAEKPGLFGTATGMDLYYICQCLAQRVEALEARLSDSQRNTVQDEQTTVGSRT